MAENKLVVSNKVGDQVIAKIEKLNEVGFTMPADYQYINAIKASFLVLQDLKDKDKRPALEVCTENSVATALFEMATKGLDASKKTCYFIVRGNQLCLHPSYFGKALQVKRIYPNFDPHPIVVHQGDELIIGIFTYEDVKQGNCGKEDVGKKYIIKHTINIENMDADFTGAYLYLPCKNGMDDLYYMTRKQILTAWSKSSSHTQTVHKEFTEKMVCKTIINSGCNMIINSTPDLAQVAEEDEEINHNNQAKEQDVQEFEEAQVIEDAKQLEQPKEQPQEQVANATDPDIEF